MLRKSSGEAMGTLLKQERMRAVGHQTCRTHTSPIGSSFTAVRPARLYLEWKFLGEWRFGLWALK
jgi:hypothetical protein